MKYLVILLMLIGHQIFAQTGSSIYPNQVFSNLFLVDVLDSHIFTLGSCNTLMISPDDGQSWTTYESPIGTNVVDIDILPNTNGEKTIMLKNDLIIVFDSKTNTYQTISDANLKLSAGKFKFIIIKEDTIYLISNTSIHKSQIGIYEWSKSTKLDIGNDFTNVSDFTDNFIWIGTDKGKILKIDFADDIALMTVDLGAKIKYMDMISDNLGYMINSSSYKIQKTIDGSKTFSLLEGMPEAISPVGWGDNIILSINTNRIYTSLDGGQTSKRNPLPDDGFSNLINGYKMTEDGVLYFVGNSSMILKSTDFAHSFIHLNKYKRENLYSISMNDKGEGYAIGGLSSFVHTTDNGENWNQIELDLGSTKTYTNFIKAIDQNKFMLGHQNGTSIIENGKVIKTESIPCEIIIKSKVFNHIIASRKIGNENIISKSLDNGDTWIDLITAPTFVRDIKESNSGTIYITGQGNTLIISDDLGENWKIQEVSGVTSAIKKIDFGNDEMGILSTGNTLYLTEDGGKTAKAFKTGYGILNLKLLDENHFIITTLSQQKTTVIETTDQGKSWEILATFCPKSYDMFYDDDSNTIWLAQEGGHINKVSISLPDKTTEASYNKPIIIYPNPISRGSTLNYLAQDTYPYALQITEVYSGKTVFEQSKLNTDEINIKNLIPGFYLMKFIGNNKVYYHKLIIE